VAALEPAIASIVRELLDDLVPEGRADLIERFAWPLPLRVLGEMLGVPAQDLPQLHRWGLDWLTLYQDAPPEEQVEHAHGLVEMQRYFVAALEQREREPTGDLMSALLEANRADPLPLEVVAGVPLDIVVAGHVTVTRAIGSAVVLLLGRPEGMAAVEQDAGPVVEEILRLESPAQACSGRPRGRSSSAASRCRPGRA
jgi:cytochrome P450